jgi:putative phage-type endonuclease
MKAHFEIEQRTPEWHAIRWGKVGGTRAKGLLGKSGTLTRDILSEQLEEYDQTAEDSGFTNQAMQRGIDLEPHAREYLSATIGVELLDCGWIQGDNPLIGISPDGISADYTVMCEMKCPQKEAYTELLMTDEIDTDYLCQIIHAFLVNEKLERHYFIAYRPESIKHAFIKEFTKDSMVDLGTKAKPVTKTVSQWVEFAKIALNQLELDLKMYHEKINTI